jgi:DNA repair exonuclease SbcCD nuclease subunit
MKVAVIADTHWGVRNDNVAFMNMSKKFLDNIFFPELEKQNIKTVIHLGDLVDRRKHISYLTASRLRADFLEPLANKGIELIPIAGNHDVYFKNTNQVNALTELIEGKYGNCNKLHINPAEIILGDSKILLLPWICADNREQSMRMIKESKAQYCMGHLELAGFEMYKGSINTHGDDRTNFDKFSLTLSGHYHHRSFDGTICYTGSHGQFTWSDYGDARGFHILDLGKNGLEFIQNPYEMFGKVWYDDTDKDLNELLNYDFSQFTNKFVKLIVTKKNNPYWFDLFCEKLEKATPIDFQIVEDHKNLIMEDENIVNEAESTIDIFKRHIDQIGSSNINKNKLTNVITDLYTQAISIE